MIRIAALDAAHQAQADVLAERLNLDPEHRDCTDWRKLPGDGLILLVGDGGLSLGCASAIATRPLCIDFADPAWYRRAQRAGRHSEALARAVGVARLDCPRVLDATAGLGRDAFVLAALGCELVMFERHPLVALLLEDGLRRAKEHEERWLREVSGRMRLLTGDAIDQLPGIACNSEAATVIYLDPMFTDGRGSAASRREMHYLQQLHGADEPQDGLLSAARNHPAAVRVVVKRPARAAPLGDSRPSHQIPGRSIRFDVYTG